MTEQITNGGFETGDLTGWSTTGGGIGETDAYDIAISTAEASVGTYSCCLVATANTEAAWCQNLQAVNLTDVATLYVSYLVDGGSSDGYFYVKIDADQVLAVSAADGVWVDEAIDVSAYDGEHDVKFWVECQLVA